MLNPLRKFILAVSLGAGIASFASVASALPVLDALAIRNAAPPTPVEEVQWRGRWGWGWGAPVAAGVVAGALLGGALAAPTTTATARIIQDLIIQVRRLCTTAIRRRRRAIRRLHPRRRPAILRRRLAIFRRHPTMPGRRRFRWGPSDLLHPALPVI